MFENVSRWSDRKLQFMREADETRPQCAAVSSTLLSLLYPAVLAQVISLVVSYKALSVHLPLSASKVKLSAVYGMVQP